MNFSPSEKLLILASLQISSPSGGGSPQYTLFRKLLNEWKIEPSNEMLESLAEIVISESAENTTP